MTYHSARYSRMSRDCSVKLVGCGTRQNLRQGPQRRGGEGRGVSPATRNDTNGEKYWGRVLTDVSTNL